LSLLIEAYWGVELRTNFCKKCEYFTGQCIYDLMASNNSLIILLWLAVGLAVAMLLLALLKPLVPRPDGPPYTRFLVWRAAVNILSRWLIVLVLVLASVILVLLAQSIDHKYMSEKVCGHHCLDHSDSDVLVVVPLETTVEYLLHDAGDHFQCGLKEPTMSRGHMSFFLSMFYTVGSFFFVAACFRALGWAFLWRVFLALLLPLCFLWPASFVLQWRVFGPITQQPLLSPIVGRQIWSCFSAASWNTFATGSLTLAILGLLGFQVMHRFVHQYFRISMMTAF